MTPKNRPASRPIRKRQRPDTGRASEQLKRCQPTPDDTRPVLFFLAGPNGSGKSTLYQLLVENGSSIPFINADLIRRTFPDAPEPDVLAQKIADLMREHFLEGSGSFATETVFSDPVGAKLEYLRRAAAKGYRVVLLATWIPSAAASVVRVSARVESGGHSVPVEKLARRYLAAMNNLREALKFVETGLVFDNSGPLEEGPKLVATVSKGSVTWKEKEDHIPKGIADLLPNNMGAVS